jgi:hypothetical protein
VQSVGLVAYFDAVTDGQFGAVARVGGGEGVHAGVGECAGCEALHVAADAGLDPYGTATPTRVRPSSRTSSVWTGRRG